MGNIYDRYCNCDQEDDRIEKLVNFTRKLYKNPQEININSEMVIYSKIKF